MESNTIVAVATVFYSILIESLPFLVLGSIISVVVHEYLPSRLIFALFRSNKVLGILFASLSGLVFPLCECGIVPIVRGLLNNKVRPAIALTAFLAIPLLNPLVIGASFYAFGSTPELAIDRLALGWVIIMIVGLCFLVFEKYIFKEYLGIKYLSLAEAEITLTKQNNRSFFAHLTHIADHAISEIFGSGKYVIMGALIAAPVQTLFKMPATMQYAVPVFVLVAMVAAVVLSLCSTSDAFVIRGFMNIIPHAAILGFLVIGPMMHLRNLIMLGSIFKPLVVIRIAIITFVVCFLIIAGSIAAGVTA